MLHTKIHDGLLVREKIFEGFLTYMGMAAILVTRPRPREQPFVLLSHGCFIWNLTSTGPVVSENKMFENVDRLQTTTEASHTIS